jgi:flagellar biosynthesis protein FlhG
MKSISITSGKGGVGKTTVTCNLARALADQGERVLIFDGDMGMANIDIMFGVRPEFSVADVVSGKRHISEVITKIDENIWLIPGGVGLDHLSKLDPFQRRYILDSLKDTPIKIDRLLIDTAPGLSDNVLYLNSAAQERLMIINGEPTSLSDSYALIKVLHQRFKVNRFNLVVNSVRSEEEGKRIYAKFSEVTSRFLNVSLDYMGSLKQDSLARVSLSQQRLIVSQYPDSSLGKAFLKLGNEIHNKNGNLEMPGGLNSFWESLVHVA